MKNLHGEPKTCVLPSVIDDPAGCLDLALDTTAGLLPLV